MTNEHAPLFTQKHYEHVERALRTACLSTRERRTVVRTLCHVFAQDNVKFKPQLFYDNCCRQTEENCRD